MQKYRVKNKKYYFNHLNPIWSHRALYLCLLRFMLLWGKLLQKIAARQAYNASHRDAL